MAKTPPEEIRDAVAENFHTYLRKGARFDRVIGAAHPDLAIDDIETLLRIHFVLTERAEEAGTVGVVDFVQELEDRIRRMKTSTTSASFERRGEVRGHIDWQQTIKTRSRSGRLDEPIYITDQPEEDYDIWENLVLKRLLSIIRAIVFEDLEYALNDPAGYGWLDAWIASDSIRSQEAESLADMFKRVFERNIYLQRIDVDSAEITDRMIEGVKQSRSPFYQEAAMLLDRYRQLMQGELESTEARQLLDNTIIAPDNPDVLFELYWIFRLLATYEEVEYRVLQPTKDDPSVIAEWVEGDTRYVMSHDSTGTALTFDESIEPTEIDSDGYLFRMNEVLSRWEELSETLFNRGTSNSLWGGRPDIVLERFRENTAGDWELESAFLGEVKYTNTMDYAATGLRELLEYMAFARRDESSKQYLEDTISVLESEAVEGLLFVDNLDIETPAPDSISVVQYSDPLHQVLQE